MNRQFPALRGLAISLVVLYHSIDMGTLAPRGLGYPPVEGWGRYVLLVFHQLGVFAVPTFLFISGCFAAYAARGTPPQLSWKTIWAGLKRILLPYLLWSILFYILIYVRRNETYTILGYVKNLLVGYPFHFVPILVFFYVISPLLVPLASRFGALLIGLIAIYQLILLNILSPGILGFVFPERMQLLVPPAVGSTMAQWGIYFPLGLVYSLNAKRVKPWLDKAKWGLAAATVAFFVLSVLHSADLIHLPLASYICPLTFILLAPLIKRNSIPLVRRLEEIGKRSYGLYLTHLIVLDLVFLVLQVTVPWVLAYQILLQPLLFATAMGIPLLVMNGIARSPARSVQRYVFG